MMKSIADIRHYSFGIFAAVLILLQSVFAAGAPATYASAEVHQTHQTEVKAAASSKAQYVEASIRIAVAPFFFYWLAKAFTLLDVPVVRFRNCKAFFVNTYSFNSYYTHLSALAP